jgi:hypothetical protein
LVVTWGGNCYGDASAASSDALEREMQQNDFVHPQRLRRSFVSYSVTPHINMISESFPMLPATLAFRDDHGFWTDLEYFNYVQYVEQFCM